MPINSTTNQTKTIRFNAEVEKMFNRIKCPRSIISIKTAIEFFNQEHTFPCKQSANLFSDKKQEAESILQAFSLSFSQPLPASPVEKNKLWKESVKPSLQAVRDIFKYKELAIQLKLPNDATREEIDALLETLRKQKEEARKKAHLKKAEVAAQLLQQKRKSLGLGEAADALLCESMISDLSLTLSCAIKSNSSYVYFKVWVLPDGQRWYKIGITTNLSRRDSEQNVLPTPATTLKIAKFPHLDFARAAEKSLLKVLSSKRIKGANNSELFRLSPPQAEAVIAAMQSLSNYAKF